MQSIQRAQRLPCCLPCQYRKKTLFRLAGQCRSLGENVSSGNEEGYVLHTVAEAIPAVGTHVGLAYEKQL
jgi:hypothetical protein